MIDDNDSALAASVAEALGWDADALERLIRSGELQNAVRDLCTMASDLSASEPTPAAFEDRVLEALRTEGVHPATQPASSAARAAAPLLRGPFARGAAAVCASVAATFTALFALMTTAAQGASGPVPVAVVSLAAGMVVAFVESNRARSESR